MNVAVDVIGPVIVTVHVNGNGPVDVIGAPWTTLATLITQPLLNVADSREMLSFQKLDVYQRSIEFLVLAHRIRSRMPKGHADLVDQLRRSAQSRGLAAHPRRVRVTFGRAPPSGTGMHTIVEDTRTGDARAEVPDPDLVDSPPAFAGARP